MGIIYVFCVTAFFGIVAIIWAKHEGHKLENMTE